MRGVGPRGPLKKGGLGGWSSLNPGGECLELLAWLAWEDGFCGERASCWNLMNASAALTCGSAASSDHPALADSHLPDSHLLEDPEATQERHRGIDGMGETL